MFALMTGSVKNFTPNVINFIAYPRITIEESLIKRPLLVLIKIEELCFTFIFLKHCTKY